MSVDEWVGTEYPSTSYSASRIPNPWVFVTSWHAGDPSPKSHFRIDFLGCLPESILLGLMPKRQIFLMQAFYWRAFSFLRIILVRE